MDNPVTILIVDDNRNFLNTLSDYIKEYYARQIQVIGGAQSCQEGIRLARDLQPQVILLDLKMPDMHGFMVIPLLRGVVPEVKIITTTLLSQELFEQSGDIYSIESLKAGADTFIPKYKLEQDLLFAIRKMIRQVLYL